MPREGRGLRRWWPFRKGEEKSYGPLDLFADIFGSSPVKSGQSVTWMTALEVTAVLACVRVLSEGMAGLPVRLYREIDRGKEGVPDHPLARILKRGPNGWQTTFEFIEQIVMHAALCGNGYALVTRRSNGDLMEMLPLLPQWVTVRRKKDWEIKYEVRIPQETGQPQTLLLGVESVLHLRGPSWDGVSGLESVKLAREAVGLSLATEEAHARLHKAGVRPSGTYSVDGTLTADQYKQLAAVIQKHQGTDNSQAPLILDRAAKWISQAMTGVDAQHLETRRYQVEEICRAFRVMPIMVGYSDKTATYASAEQMFLQHVVHTLTPWARRLESVFARDLLREADLDGGLYVKFILQGLMRGDAKARAEFYTRMVLAGIMTPNEVRELEDLNHVEGGDDLRAPLNTAPAADARSDSEG